MIGRRIFPLAVCVLSTLSLMPGKALAEGYVPFDLIGGVGGERYRVECPGGMRLVGFSGRRGNWIDGIAPLCAEIIANPQKKTPWDQELVYGARFEGAYHGGPGGEPYSIECKDGAWASSMSVRPTWEEADRFVLGVILHCPRAGNWWTGDEDPNVSDVYFGQRGKGLKIVHETPVTPPRVGVQKCKSGDVATGIELRAGKHLDAISIVCSTPPKPAAPPPPPDITGIGGTSPTRNGGLPSDVTGVGGASTTRRGSGGASNIPPAPPVEPPAPVEPPQAATARFDAPSIMSDAGAVERVDYCLNFAANCGDVAASAFCAATDPARPRAIEAPLEFGVGRTFTIGDRQLCLQENCSSFTHIVCSAN